MEKSLRTSELNFMNQNTQFNSRTILEYYRKFLCRYNNGLVNREQFRLICENLIIGKDDAEEKMSMINLLFDLCDKDESGYIDFKEYLVLFWSRIIGPEDQKLGLIFELYDLNNSGYIDFHEMHSIVKVLFKLKYSSYGPSDYSLFTNQEFISSNLPISYYIAMDIMKTFDLDRNGKLTKQEFIEGCLNHQNFRIFLSPLKINS
ncbi:Neuronal calcium sensor 2 [Brachionus plicatilis]|uniref:Neuronal calcium sensor 2 n=1 Tax=Brachionus plicatilis TaxID=10195 RepID=A0A3M7RYY4_BRAPC|nr:Neuronal calcium sensor 2 [Brachionus plicatilis]